MLKSSMISVNQYHLKKNWLKWIIFNLIYIFWQILSLKLLKKELLYYKNSIFGLQIVVLKGYF